MATVLLVEDHDDFRMSLAELLHLDGWRALTARTLDEARVIAQRGGIDVVLSDVLLPGGRGLDLNAMFKGDPNLAAIPFVFMTGYRPHVDELAPDCVLLKPLDIHAAVEALARAIASRCDSRR